MRISASVLSLVASSAFAYQVTYPGNSQGWDTIGPNVLKWERVDTDPLNFTVVLTNVNRPGDQVLLPFVDGTLGSTVCPPPTGGWPTGSGFRVNLAQDSSHPDSLLAQSSQFNITTTSSDQPTTSATSTQTATSTVSGSTASLSSSDTSTTPTGTSAAPLGAQIDRLVTFGALTVLVTTLFRF